MTDSAVVSIIDSSFNIAGIDISRDTTVVYFDTSYTCRDLAEDIYNIHGWPTVIFLDYRGDYRGMVVGYYDAETSLISLEYVVENFR